MSFIPFLGRKNNGAGDNSAGKPGVCAALDVGSAKTVCFIAKVEQGAGEISALDIVENAKAAGDTAPDFDLAKYGGGRGSLDGYLAKGPLVLTFYRGVWCPYCNLQLKEYDDRLSEITDLGATLVAVTPEKPNAYDILKEAGVQEEILAEAATNVGFDVLYDEGNTLARDLGIIFELPKTHQNVLTDIGIDIEVLTGNTTFGFADPATYVIGQDKKIVKAFVPNNYRKRCEVDMITAALKSI